MDETYERILNKIPEENHRDAHTVMQLLAVSCRSLSISEVAEAIAVNYEDEVFEPENDRLRDVNEVLEICSSLVTMSGYCDNIAI